MSINQLEIEHRWFIVVYVDIAKTVNTYYDIYMFDTY